jgi:hypothetical protein
MASALGLTLSNVKVAVHRLYKMSQLNRYCPECFKAEVSDGVCKNCGYEPYSPDLPTDEQLTSAKFNQVSPGNSLHAGNLLGSTVGYRDYGYSALGFTNRGFVLKQRIDESIEDPLLRRVKSDVMNELKRYYPSPEITDCAGKLCIKEVLEFQTRYPKLARSKNARDQLTNNVMKRLELLYAQFSAPGTSRRLHSYSEPANGR